MNILKWMWKILPIMLLAVNATACNDDDDSGKRERPLTFEVTFLSLVCNYTRPVVVNAPFTGKDYHLTVTASPEVTWKVEVVSGDLDCTNGTPIVVNVELTDTKGMELKAGKGVGIVTRPGLQVKIGKPAINPGPQIMLRYVFEELIGKDKGCIVTISIPEGEELAKQTLNPAIGIKGGISVLGTTGIVKPMSEDAYKRSLAPQVPVVWADGYRTAVLCPGRIGENAAKIMGIPEGAIIETSNFIGFMMEQCIARGFEKMILVGHMGKLVKVASGSFHTYNRNSDGRMETMAAYAAANGASKEVVREILDCNTTDGAAIIIHREHLDMIYSQMAERAQVRSERYIFGKSRVGVIFAGMDGTIQAVSSHAKDILEEEGWNIH